MTGVPVMPTSGAEDAVAAGAEVGRAVDGGTAGRYQARLFIQRSRIRVDRVHAVVLGRDIDDVVRAAGNVHPRQIQRLRIHSTVDGHGKQLSELIAVDVGGSEEGLWMFCPLRTASLW